MGEQLEYLKSAIAALSPPPKWRPAVAIALGVLLGIGLTALKISNATAYLSDEPEACINCHLMYPQYSTWKKSSHRIWTNCNDCHVPHNNVFREYWFHAADGARHSTIFTLNMAPQVIRINEPGKTVIQENCIRCHEKTVNQVSIFEVTNGNNKHGKGHLCWDCHREVPHGRVHSQASTPNAIVPGLSPAAPDWLNKLVK